MVIKQKNTHKAIFIIVRILHLIDINQKPHQKISYNRTSNNSKI